MRWSTHTSPRRGQPLWSHRIIPSTSVTSTSWHPSATNASNNRRRRGKVGSNQPINSSGLAKHLHTHLQHNNIVQQRLPLQLTHSTRNNHVQPSGPMHHTTCAATTSGSAPMHHHLQQVHPAPHLPSRVVPSPHMLTLQLPEQRSKPMQLNSIPATSHRTMLISNNHIVHNSTHPSNSSSVPQ